MHKNSTADLHEIEEIFADPDYDQTQLQDYFRRRYGELWTQAWRRYLETGDIV